MSQLIYPNPLIEIAACAFIKPRILVHPALGLRPEQFAQPDLRQTGEVRLVHNTIAIDVGRGDRGLIDLGAIGQM